MIVFYKLRAITLANVGNMLKCVHCSHSRRHVRIFKKFAHMVNFFAGFSFEFTTRTRAHAYNNVCTFQIPDEIRENTHTHTHEFKETRPK